MIVGQFLLSQIYNNLRQFIENSVSPLIATFSTFSDSMYVCAKLLQLCPTLCNPMDCSPLGSSVHGILQARILEWVTMTRQVLYH